MLIVTWGELDENTYKLLVDKKGRKYKEKLSDSKGKIKYNKFVDIGEKKINKVFRLNNPKKGYGRKGHSAQKLNC